MSDDEKSPVVKTIEKVYYRGIAVGISITLCSFVWVWCLKQLIS